jgi:hypothetical protein|tara:strand:- start:1062 stop:1787 length:726 start_codon:yes stop_codon:yes gene_type:complete
MATPDGNEEKTKEEQSVTAETETETTPTVEELQAKLEAQEQELQRVRSIAGNVQARKTQQQGIDELRDEMRHTRLMAEAAMRGMSEEQAEEYVLESATRAGIIRQVNDVGNMMSESLTNAGVNMDDPRLQAAYALWEDVNAAAKTSDQTIDTAKVFRVEGMVREVIDLERTKQHELALLEAREEGSKQAKQALEEGGILNMGQVGSGSSPSRKPQSLGEASKLYYEGKLSDADYAPWLAIN